MVNYLEFKNARCKDCYKCLRECPVKAIEVIKHQAQIIDKRCILCGKCTSVCPQNAKKVHSEKEAVLKLLQSGKKVVASVAPSFVSSFGVKDFNVFKIALGKLGFSDAEETAVGAAVVTEKYKELLLSGKYKNLITSACPAVNRMIRLYYPEALPYLATVDSPMLAHAKMLKKRFPDARLVFIGPCIAKKREAAESGLLSGVLTFEDLKELFDLNGIILSDIANIPVAEKDSKVNRAKYYPISRGIIKSFENYIDGYEFVAVDGADKCREVLENIDSLSNMFLELNSCEYACINGPCSLIHKGVAVKANAEIREYTNKDIASGGTGTVKVPEGIDFSLVHGRIKPDDHIPSMKEIEDILAKTGKFTPEDELNCGACGYNTCREKAWAVANGYADIEMCVPYMRERAESMSNEIIENSPNGIILINYEFKIIDINSKAVSLYGIQDKFIKGRELYEFIDASDFMTAVSEEKNIYRKKLFIPNTKKFAELSIIVIKKEKVLFGVFKDITEETAYDEKLSAVKLETISTTDEVIKKQMRVAQEIASLLGETTAETKVALLKLKKTLLDENKGD